MKWLTALFDRQPLAPFDPAQRPREAVEHLRRLDGRHRVFGATKHRYHLHRHTEAELEGLERQVGTPLPVTYRRHLLETGSGVGPFYGLLPAAESFEVLACATTELAAEEGIRVCVANPFPFTSADVKAGLQRLEAHSSEPFLVSTWPVSGCIPICHHGCSEWAVLVIQGEYAGCIWDVNNQHGHAGWWIPSARPPRCTLPLK